MLSKAQRASKVVDDVLENSNWSSHSLSIELIITIFMSLQESMIKLQNAMHVVNEMDIWWICMQWSLNIWKSYLLWDAWISNLEIKKRILEAKQESFIKSNVEMKSNLETKEDSIMVKWKDVLIKKTPTKNFNEVNAPEFTPNIGLHSIKLYKRQKRK